MGAAIGATYDGSEQTSRDAASRPIPASLTCARRLVLLVTLLLTGMLATACTDVQQTQPTTPLLGPCPVPTPNVIPTAWKPVGSGTLTNVDGDQDYECLVVYRYNVTGTDQGPLGAVIFDPQVGSDRLSRLSAYRLLPGIEHSYSISQTAPGSALSPIGALGEKAVEVRLYDTDADGIPDELGLVGSDAAGNNTALTLFRWVNETSGYRLAGYFHGNARVAIPDGPVFQSDVKFYNGPVRTVRTVDRLFDRSGLAMYYQYERNDATQTFDYRANWLDFGDGRPGNTCYYPEGQTLAYYQDQGKQVFDLRLFTEDEATRKATVCVGTWDIQATQWRRYWAMAELDRKPATSVGACDQWTVARAPEQPGRDSCNP
jgi:hypothetical protein